ncbi:Beta-glucosidase 24 [Linum perenne]
MTVSIFTVSVKVLLLIAVCLPHGTSFSVDAGFNVSYTTSSAAAATAPFNRSIFPSGFLFGTASSAYQYEGAAAEGGRGPSIWDTFVKIPGKIVGGATGDVAVDEYHRYKEDVKLMKDMGVDAFRFSISWSRILPNGKVSGGVNKVGVTYYNNLINELLANDRVKNWITLNEPLTFTQSGYVSGEMAPGHCSKSVNSNCTKGDSSTEPYLASHNQLLAHAAAVKVYRERYQAKQKGIIGITLVSSWYIPYSNSKHDRRARQRALDFGYGWFMDPLTNGEYPKSMRSLVGDRLPKFSKEEAELVKGSFDFIGLNYYSSNYVANTGKSVNSTYFTDSEVKLSSVDEVNNEEQSLEHALADVTRIYYYHLHLDFLNKAIDKGANVKGYFAWSLLDNFEWATGYSVRFGIYYVDYKDGFKRYPKRSAHWFRSFLRRE